jgi:membrane associated rhomboid family serine protease
MFTLYSFGQVVEAWGSGLRMIILFATGVIVASLPSFLKNRQNSYYRSLGASGGVASVLFFTIYFAPRSAINIFLIPIDIPMIVFGVLYLIYSAYMSRRGDSTINHDAHFWGSVYGLVFAFVNDPTHGESFIRALMRS